MLPQQGGCSKAFSRQAHFAQRAALVGPTVPSMPIPTNAFAHARLSVTDTARSRAIYDEVFGLPVRDARRPSHGPA